ncbi:hypothetical protein [Flagellimonas olearia]|nr:hypothetical protein [Allomuricauda olearia]
MSLSLRRMLEKDDMILDMVHMCNDGILKGDGYWSNGRDLPMEWTYGNSE